jgi:two-component system CheB/CheR fusion protein
MHMEILIQSTKSPAYLQPGNSWTTDRQDAMAFVSSDEAIACCQANRITEVMPALKFDSRFDLTIALEQPAPVRPRGVPVFRLAEKKCNPSPFIADCLYVGGLVSRTTTPVHGSSGFTMSKRSPKKPKATQAKVASSAKQLRRRGPKAAQPGQSKRRRPGSSSTTDFPVVGIGASAGGYEAMAALLQHLGEKTGMAYVLIQHLDPSRKSQLVELLSRVTKMSVSEITDNTRLEPNHFYIVPPNHNVAMLHGILHLMPRSPATVQMAVDYFFRSLAEDHGAKSIGVVLSGTGSDGTAGLRAIKAAGGVTIAQDEKSAGFNGMPGSAVAAGCVDFILSPHEIAGELGRIGAHPYIQAVTQPDRALTATAEELNKVYILLRSVTGADFTYYKDTTIQRRIARRMLLHRIETMENYLRYLQSHSEEVKALFQDILINVTSFFREPQSFDLLKEKVFPSFLKDGKREEPIRIWTAGCSTGEETYSVAISLVEFLQEKAANTRVQIFGTDLSESSMEKARAGFYPESIIQDVGSVRLRRFFDKSGTGYRITKPIRDLCVFARHDLTRDPPFSRLDLILCRNVLIYLGNALQKKIIKVFHYALRNPGWLILGSSETVGGSADLFALRDKKHKIYSRKSAKVIPGFALTPTNYALPEALPIVRAARDLGRERPGFDIIKEADHLVISKFAPPGVLVNEDMNILQFRGDTENYLVPSPGEASLNILRMAREGLLFELRSALYKAIKHRVPVSKEGLRVEAHNMVREVALEILPLKGKQDREIFFLVLFREKAQAPLSKLKVKALKASGTRQDETIGRLKHELKATNEYLQAIIEEQEATNEEIRSANEETQSSNEELQSTNEELETAKEELQSTNEELTTVNEELHNRNIELSQSNNDLNNLLSNVNIPIIILGDDMRIRRFTPQAEVAMNLIPADIGRSLKDIKLNIEVPDLEAMVLRVIKTLIAEERDVQDRTGRWYLLRVRPYRTTENKIDGAVLALVDIEALRQGLQQLKDARAYLRALGQVVPGPLLILDRNLKVQIANQAFAQLFRTPIEEVEGKLIYDLGDGAWNLEQLHILFEDLLLKSNHLEEFEVKGAFPKIGPRVLSMTAQRVVNRENETQLILLVMKERQK